MSKIRFTPEQEQVIFAKNCTTLVSAAAGSGKTAVLVQRIIEKLIDKDTPADINRLLVVTFTKAAAAEMRERIGKRLNEYLAKPEYAANEHLQKQVLFLKNAQITTIHSFCMSVLKEFFYELDMDPTFRVAEESELTLLKADVMEELLEDCYEEGEENFLRLSECVGGKTDQGLEDLLLKLYKFAQSAPFPERWLATISKNLEEQETMQSLPEDGDIVRYIKEQADIILRESRSILREAMALCQAPQGPIVYMDALESDEKLLDDLSAKKTYKELKEAFGGLSYERLSGKKCDTTEEKKAQVKALREVYKKLLGKFKEDYFFDEEVQMCADMAAMVPLMQKLIELCAEYGKRFGEKKAERGLVDYNDLEHLTVKLLIKETEEGYEATETALRLRKRFDEIMIDECQDSNEIQELLLSAISGEAEGRPNRFMVGDVKQSIYKFRMAKPELFMAKYDAYKKYAPGEEYCKIILGRNFRSRRSVITPVNEVFACLMRREFGGIEYDEEAALNPGATYPWDTEECKEKEAYAAEFLLTEVKDDSDEDEDTDRTAKEAMAVGGRIRSLIDSGLPIYDGEETDEDGNVIQKFHPVDYRDIMILFRSPGTTAPVFSEVFSELGIPSVVEKQSRYFDAQEVNVVLNMLRVIDNPRQDIPLVSVLRSEMVGMTEEELALVRIEAKEKEKEQGKAGGCDRPYRFFFYEAISIFLAKAEEGTAVTAENVFFESAAEKLQQFLSRLEQLRKLALYAGVPEVLEELYRLTDYPAFVRVKPGGLRRAENLAMLVGKAKSYEEGSYSGIFDFIRYIERLTKYETEIGEAQIDSGENAVRMLSIHKSKGLEAPVVIVAGLGKKFNTKDMTANLVMHPELGMGMEYRDEVLRVKAPTLYKKVIAGHLNYDMLSEELRVLYVALTRAREKLILSAAADSSEKFFDSVNNVVLQEGRAGYSALLQAHSLLDFLMLPLGQCLATGSIRLVGKEEVQADTENAVLTEEAVRQSNRERYDALTVSRDEVQDEGLDEEIRQREAYVYPYPVCKGKMKLSVSELKKAAYEDEVQEEMFPERSPEKTVPKFISGKTEEAVSGSERGTLYHRVMECLDFCAACDTAEAVQAQLQELIDRGRIRKDALQLVSADKIAAFFRSKLGLRMCLAAKEGRLKKEQPFVIGIPYEEVYKEEGIKNSGEMVMVQGIIDAYFEEDGQLILMDYKTDSVNEDVKEELTKRYKAQLMYYGMALSQMTGMPVKEKMIYAFTSGEAFGVE